MNMNKRKPCFHISPLALCLHLTPAGTVASWNNQPFQLCMLDLERTWFNLSTIRNKSSKHGPL